MNTSHIKIKSDGSLRIIQLSRPEALNALGLEMLTELRSALLDAFSDASVKSIWLESAHEKAFCAGGDVKSLAVAIDELSLPLEKSALGRRYFELEYGVDGLIENSPKPIVGFANGLVYGGGWGLFAGANLRLCSSAATFAMPENQIGFYPDVGAAHFLQHVNWKVGTFIGLTGFPIRAAEAMALDYVDDIISTDYAETLQQQLAEGIDVTELDIDSADTSVNAINEQWKSAMELLPEDAALNDWMTIAEQNPTVEPFERAIQAWKTASPWSIAFTWHYFSRMRDTKRLSVLEFDVEVGAFFCTHADFYEGVHAKLIDKNRLPNWLYPHVESVPLEKILEAFE